MKKITFLLLFCLGVFTINAQTKEELEAQKAEKQAEADKAQAEADALQAQIGNRAVFFHSKKIMIREKGLYENAQA